MIIDTPNGIINASNMVEQSMKLRESICSETTLRFGLCEASTFKVRLCEVFIPVKGLWITVSRDDYVYGKYKVHSDKPTADRRFRDIVAYDAMYDILIADVAAWYNTILPNADSTVTLKEFRDSFFSYLGIEQEEVTLVNDTMTIEKTVEPSQMSGKTVITAICEINGCFGHIGRNGKFRYVFLPEMTEGTYPEESLQYISAEYEDFTTERITKVRIRKEENDIGATYPYGSITESDNCYIVQDNFLVYGKGTEELEGIAANMFSVIRNVWYRPAHVTAKGNPCLEVGDAIRVSTTNCDIYTYILQRTLKGIQALRDTYDAEGDQRQKEKPDSIQNQIIQLKGKANVLERTIEETKLTISDVEKGLQNKITMNAQGIEGEIKRATDAEGVLSNRITSTADSFSLEISNLQNQIDGNIITYNLNYVPTLTNYPAWDWAYNIPCNGTVQLSDTLAFEYKDEYWRKNARSVVFNTETFVTYRFLEQNGIWGWIEIADSEYSYLMQQISELKITDESIAASVKSLEEEIVADYITTKSAQSLIEQTANSITTEVANTYETKDNASSQYSSLKSSITQTAESITSEVTRASNAESELSSRITQNASNITSEVNRASAAEGNLSTRIEQNATAITQRVQKGSIISEINQTAETVTIKASKIDLVGLVNATEFTSKFATITSLNAVSAKVNSIDADYASIGDLNAVSARVNSIEADYITAGQLNAVSARVNYVYADYVQASTLGDDVVTAISGKSVYLGALNASGIVNANAGLTISGYDVGRKTATIGGVTINYWGWD